ncbi:NAD(P)H-dependent oxidoreductase [Agrobacterium tumefaciens]|uniref:NAD(P)H-dependent oxidoreductase n=1 Tax=Agrobacterium tumefaciens TaxID=358 RepID=UPI001ADD0AD7|nr:NAD(P)H-dependent oxidoreductase [Agrobacterium tumefaciens]QTK78947.1 NAD(P)H-dependent oxidoreductase [Agrobacterium tumefaciens]
MRILVVLAHPLEESFAAGVAETIRRKLLANGHTVDFLDLYRENFDPRLTSTERARYFQPDYDVSEAEPFVRRLQQADGLVLVFPQWWFNFPAILKGYVDRVFVPGVAFDNDPAGGRLRPKLRHIRVLWAFTSTGSPWWIVHLYMGNPVRRLLKRGIAAFCARGLDFKLVNLYDMDRSNEEKRRAHLARVEMLVGRL